MNELHGGAGETLQAAGGYGPPGGGGYGGPPPPPGGGGGWGGPPPGGGGYGQPPGGGGFGPPPGGGGGGYGQPPGGFGQPPGGFGGPGAPGGYNAPGFGPPGMPVGSGGPQYHQMALIALGLGIASFLVTTCCCCFGGWSMPLSIGAVVVGFLGLKQVKESSAYKGEAFCWVGIGAGAFGIVCCLVALLSSVDEQLLSHRHF